MRSRCCARRERAREAQGRPTTVLPKETDDPCTHSCNTSSSTRAATCRVRIGGSRQGGISSSPSRSDAASMPTTCTARHVGARLHQACATANPTAQVPDTGVPRGLRVRGGALTCPPLYLSYSSGLSGSFDGRARAQADHGRNDAELYLVDTRLASVAEGCWCTRRCASATSFRPGAGEVGRGGALRERRVHGGGVWNRCAAATFPVRWPTRARSST